MQRQQMHPQARTTSTSAVPVSYPPVASPNSHQHAGRARHHPATISPGQVTVGLLLLLLLC
jgi:hypothetical protein